MWCAAQLWKTKTLLLQHNHIIASHQPIRWGPSVRFACRRGAGWLRCGFSWVFAAICFSRETIWERVETLEAATSVWSETFVRFSSENLPCKWWSGDDMGEAWDNISPARTISWEAGAFQEPCPQMIYRLYIYIYVHIINIIYIYIYIYICIYIYIYVTYWILNIIYSILNIIYILLYIIY